MDMWTATMLPLKSELVIFDTQKSHIEGFNELLNAVAEKPITKCRVVDDGSGTAGAGARILS